MAGIGMAIGILGFIVILLVVIVIVASIYGVVVNLFSSKKDKPK